MQRIAVCGSHGVGKSSLAKQLSKSLLLPRIDEVGRSIAKGWFKNSDEIRNSTVVSKILFQLNYFYKQIAEEEHYLEFVSDRAVFDVVAYSIYYQLPEKIVNMLTEDAVEHSEKYDLIIYCPIPDDGELTADGFRFTDKESQVEIDRILQELLKKAKCEVFRLGKYRNSWFSEALTFINCRRKGITINAG